MRTHPKRHVELSARRPAPPPRASRRFLIADPEPLRITVWRVLMTVAGVAVLVGLAVFLALGMGYTRSLGG